MRPALSNVRCALLLLLCAIAPALAPAAEWRPARAPLMTRWAAEVSPTNAHPEYPRPQMVRADWLNLNGLWDYGITAPGDVKAPTNFAGSLLVPFPVESALSGVMRPLEDGETLWYRRRIQVPESWRGRRVRLHFGAADWQTRVSVNGHFVGQHCGGYDRFSFDLTPHLAWNGREEVLIAVTDPTEADQPRGKQSRRPEGIFYTPNSGIWQTLWLEPVPEGGLDDLRLTPDLDRQCLRLRAAVGSFRDRLRIRAVASTPTGEVASVTGEANVELLLPMSGARQWSPDDPFLYDVRVELRDGKRVLDAVQSYFGMRKVGLGRDARGVTRVTLNDRFVFQVGTLDQGFWPEGIYTAPTDEALRSDIEFLKRAGFNLTRKHVKVEPDRWYYWCDRLGLLVWQDMPSGNSATADGRREFEAGLRHLLTDLHNHPSIITWVLFNEGWGQYDTERLAQWLKTMDPSRLVNSASGWTDLRVGDLIDGHSYPGPDSPEPEPRRAAVLGEFGGLGLIVPGHTWSARSWSYRMRERPEELTADYTRLMRQVWSLHELRGLSAAIYTQTTDVETECNGLLTYDRAVVKPDLAALGAANRGTLRAVPGKVLLPNALLGRSLWKYTLAAPKPEWFRPGFDDSAWKEAPAGFGAPDTPGALCRTTWDTADIWLRREFVIPDGEEVHGARLLVHHDEDAEIYLNGVLAARLPGYVLDNTDYPLTPEAAATLRAGVNTIAVHCHQTTGGQFIDVAIVVPSPRADPRPAHGEKP